MGPNDRYNMWACRPLEALLIRLSWVGRTPLRPTVAVSGLSGLLIAASLGFHPSPTTASPRPLIRAVEWRPSAETLIAASTDLHGFRSPFPFHALGVLWRGSAPPLQIRTRGSNEEWRPWEDVRDEDDAPARSGESASGLITFAPAVEAQLRVAPGEKGPWPHDLRLVAIDPEPRVSQATPTRPRDASPTLTPTPRPAPTATTSVPEAPPKIISRKEWGADPKLMTWAPEYQPVRKFVVHHTATSDGGASPAAAIRAIYYYHAVTLGWGDIAYNYLIDRGGNVYEGRSGGPNAVGAHAGPYSEGVDGIGLLGTYDEVQPSEPMLASLVSLIAWRARSQNVDPLGTSFMVDRTLPNVFGHRDVMATDCPGEAMYGLLPSVRQRAAALPAIPPTRPSIRVVSARIAPPSLSATDTVRVDVTLTNAGPDPLATQGPDPGTVYGETDTFLTLGHPEQPGRIRIGVEVDGGTEPDRRFRWGIGTDLAPGETRTVSGFIRFDRPGAHTIWVGVVDERVDWLHDNLGRTAIRVHPPGASSYMAAAAPATDLYFPLAIREHNSWNTRLALMNTSSRAARGAITFVGADGRASAIASISLPPLGSAVYDAASIPALGVEYTGAAVVRADAALVGIAFHERPDSDRMAAEPFAAGSSRLYAPLVARSYHGLSSGVQVQNLGATTATASVTYVQDTGATWTETSRVAPLASTTFYAPAHADLPDGFVGSAIVESAQGQPLAAQVNLVRSDGLAASYSAQGAGSTATAAPLVYRNHDGWSSGLQIENVGSLPAMAVASLATPDGQGGPWEERGVIGHAISATLYLPALPQLPDDLVVSATVRASNGEPLLVLATNVNARKGVGTVVGGLAEGAPTLYAPSISNDVEGWRSDVQLHNRTGQAVPVRLIFLDALGARVLQIEDSLPPWGVKTYRAPDIQGLPAGFSGSLAIVGRPGALLSAVVNDLR